MYTDTARQFAREWFARAEGGRDEKTLAAMLEWLLRDTANEARKDERKRIERSFARIVLGTE